jgi:hypothetical protein
MRLHLPTRLFPLRVRADRRPAALQRPIAPRRGGGAPTARLDSEGGGLLDRLHRAIAGRLAHHCPLAPDPGDAGRAVFGLLAPPRRARLPAPTGATPPRLRATTWRLALRAGGRLAVRRVYRALPPALGFGGDGRMAEPPAPALPGPGLAPSLPRNTARRAR